MTKQKSDYRARIIVAIIGVIGILIGTFGTIIIKPKIETPPPGEAKVDQYNGVYVFIRSNPKSDYDIITTVETNSLNRAVESASGKKGFWKVLGNATESLLKDLSFENRINAITEEARKVYPDVQGLVFIDDLTKCQVIKFR
jgi:hypothetical protein